jgi:hypothetical protein
MCLAASGALAAGKCRDVDPLHAVKIFPVLNHLGIIIRI